MATLSEQPKLLGVSKETILKNILSNSQHLLDRWKPGNFSVVDRSKSLHSIYQKLAQPLETVRKPILTITGAPGSGKTLLTALALNKIKPASEPINGSTGSFKDVLDLNKKEDDAEWTPVYLSFNDLTSISSQEGNNSDDIFRNRVLYWLLTDCSEHGGYKNFLNQFIMEKQLPDMSEIVSFLESFGVKVVFFIDELRKLEDDDLKMKASVALTEFIRSIEYDSSNTYIFASSLLRSDFTRVNTLSYRHSITINVKLISSFDELISPLLSSLEPIGEFLRADSKNVEMLKMFLWGCLGHPRLVNRIINESVKDFSKESVRLQVYQALKEKAITWYAEMSQESRMEVKLVAAAFCQYNLPDLNERMESINFCDYSASYIRKPDGSISPFVSPFLMEYFSTNPPSAPLPLEKKFVRYLRDLFSYIEIWTTKVIENPEREGFSFEGFVPLWLRTYFAARRLCDSIKAPEGIGADTIDEIFNGSCLYSLEWKNLDLHLQPQYWLLKSGDYMLKFYPNQNILAHSEDEVSAYRFIAGKKCKYREEFSKGQLMVMPKENNPGYDCYLCMIDSAGKPVYLFFEFKYLTIHAGQRFNTIDEARRKYNMILKEFKGKPSALGNHALVFFTLKDFKASDEEIKAAGFPLIVFSRKDILKLIGPSLGFVVPLHGQPERYVPQDYFIH